jgi:hypothetical protein
MTRDEISLLIKAMRANGVTRLEWSRKRKGTTLRLSLGDDTGATHRSHATETPPIPALVIKSPGIGRFVPRGTDDGLKALAPGDRVGVGEPLGYIAQGEGILQLVVAPANGRFCGMARAGDHVFGFGDEVLELEGTKE